MPSCQSINYRVNMKSQSYTLAISYIITLALLLAVTQSSAPPNRNPPHPKPVFSDSDDEIYITGLNTGRFLTGADTWEKQIIIVTRKGEASSIWRYIWRDTNTIDTKYVRIWVAVTLFSYLLFTLPNSAFHFAIASELKLTK